MKPSRTQQALVGLGVLLVIMATLLGGLIVAVAEKSSSQVDIAPTASCIPTNICPPTPALAPEVDTPEQDVDPTCTATSAPSPTRRPTRTATETSAATWTPSPISCRIAEGWVPYQICSGDTLFLIGMRFGVQVDTLLEANCLNSTVIHSGDTIYVPPVTPRPLPTGEISATTTLVTVDPTTVAQSGLTATPTLTATDGACTHLDSIITSPRVGTLLMGTLQITGTARTPNFASYRLELRQEGTQQPFATIFTGYEPVANGMLAEINTLDWPNGEYWLRLVVLDAQNNYPERCSILIAFYNCDDFEWQ
ncbi:MAG: LysM peptidoglycan-binding domain-containing protein [Anaerolineae bacterium]|nr:LysM peptidoglycan-binding domain-containing protein [Anaerolineae bacterium]